MQNKVKNFNRIYNIRVAILRTIKIGYNVLRAAISSNSATLRLKCTMLFLNCIRGPKLNVWFQKYCYCGQQDGEMVECDSCGNWYHLTCIEAKEYLYTTNPTKLTCPECILKAGAGPISLKRRPSDDDSFCVTSLLYKVTPLEVSIFSHRTPLQKCGMQKPKN